MVVVEKLLFGEVEHKVELFPFAVHWALLSCESRGWGVGGREGGWVVFHNVQASVSKWALILL